LATPRLAVLVSGSGTILEAMLAYPIPVALVVSDRLCRALDVARDAVVDTTLVDRSDFGGFTRQFDRDGFTRALTARLVDADVGLVAMAGFGTIVGAEMHNAFAGRVLNTHPSLLPEFPGWHAVRDALQSGAQITGCTVHIATETLDDGPILAQRTVEVRPDDNESTLHERIKAAERVLYPEVVSRVLATIADGGEPFDAHP
jgi:phosphoribosylglycinamide formyltransferase 1